MKGVTMIFIAMLGTAAFFMSANGLFQPDNDASEFKSVLANCTVTVHGTQKFYLTFNYISMQTLCLLK